MPCIAKVGERKTQLTPNLSPVRAKSEGAKMCLGLRKSRQFRTATLQPPADGSAEEHGGNRDTPAVIRNKTGYTLVLRDIHRYAAVRRNDRLELKPNESKSVAFKTPSAFFRMGDTLSAAHRADWNLDMYIDSEQLVVGRKQTSVRHENGRRFADGE